MSEAPIQKLKSIAAKVRASEASSTLDSEVSDDAEKSPNNISQEEKSNTSSPTTHKKETKVIFR